METTAKGQLELEHPRTITAAAAVGGAVFLMRRRAFATRCFFWRRRRRRRRRRRLRESSGVCLEPLGLGLGLVAVVVRRGGAVRVVVVAAAAEGRKETVARPLVAVAVVLMSGRVQLVEVTRCLLRQHVC
jgi:hypothetical protein